MTENRRSGTQSRRRCIASSRLCMYFGVRSGVVERYVTHGCAQRGAVAVRDRKPLEFN